jgi:magnesium and cobalt transporter
MLAGHVPARGEIIRHPDGPEFEVVDADPRRIKRLRVRLDAAPVADVKAAGA